MRRRGELNAPEAAHQEMIDWRTWMHANPELGFEEHATSNFIAKLLGGFGVDELHRGLGVTGLVGVIKGRTGRRAIGLRADMDALPIEEESEAPHRSLNAGVMHACGHDGHVAMLLGAARALCTTRDFAGTVYLIFQPAEEALGIPVPGSQDRRGGALAMIRDGLFERFPMEAIFGLHNRPGIGAGKMGTRQGVIYAAVDRFDIEIIGRGCHAARPHLGIDPIVVAAHLVTALQTIASRFFNPLDAVVVSVCQIAGGAAFNVIADSVQLIGTVRALSEQARTKAQALVEQLARGVATTFGADARIDYQVGYPALHNEPTLTAQARAAISDVAGDDNVVDLDEPTMGGEDFACYLAHVPGCFALIGNGTDGRHGLSVHNARYDFNDAVLALGARYWQRLVERQLSG